MSTDAVETALSFVSKIPDLLRSTGADSLVEFTTPTRVEPIVLMEDRVSGLSLTPDLMQALTAIFSGYYLQAVALSVNIGKIDVIGLLDRLNPNRSMNDAMARGILNLGTIAGAESRLGQGIPWPKSSQINGQLRLSQENIYKTAMDVAGETEESPSSASRSGRDMVKYAQEATALSVGKLLEVEIESDGHKATFPIQVRLITTLGTQKGLFHVMTVGSGPKTVKERWHAWRSGQLTFWRDLVLCQDLIENHRDALMKDSSGLYAASLARRHKNALTGILTGVPSVATASNILIITYENQKQIERQLGGRLTDFRVRQKVFQETMAMLIVSVNEEWETVTLFHRSIKFHSEFSASDLKLASKNSGANISDILKAYTLGQAPRF